MESKKGEITAVGESGIALQSWRLIHSPALRTKGLYLGVWHGDNLFPSELPVLFKKHCLILLQFKFSEFACWRRVHEAHKALGGCARQRI